MQKACDLINQLSPSLVGKDLTQFKKVDDALKNFKNKREEQGETVGLNVTSAVSQAIFFAFAYAQNPRSPFQSIYKQATLREMRKSDRNPSIMFTVLNGGKDLASKIKFSKFFLIFCMTPGDDFDAEAAYYKICQAIEKGVSATKQGVAGFKKGSPDGSYFNAFDNIGECFKLLEDAITSVGSFKVGKDEEERQPFKIGVSCDSNNWFVEEANKYEWDGPKNQMDVDQLIEFYEKMCNDHPLLEYIEDPMQKGEIKGVKKFMEKLTTSHPKVKVGINSMFNSNLDTIKEFTQLIQEDSEEEEEPVEGEEQEKPPAEEVPPAEEKPKEVKKGKKGEVIEEAEVEDPNKKPDPNALKFIPGGIRISKNTVGMMSSLQSIVNYSLNIRQENFGLVIEDNQVESLKAEVVDLAFGCAQISYLNLSGFGKHEKTSKIKRYGEIIGKLSV